MASAAGAPRLAGALRLAVVWLPSLAGGLQVAGAAPLAVAGLELRRGAAAGRLCRDGPCPCSGQVPSPVAAALEREAAAAAARNVTAQGTKSVERAAADEAAAAARRLEPSGVGMTQEATRLRLQSLVRQRDEETAQELAKAEQFYAAHEASASADATAALGGANSRQAAVSAINAELAKNSETYAASAAKSRLYTELRSTVIGDDMPGLAKDLDDKKRDAVKLTRAATAFATETVEVYNQALRVLPPSMNSTAVKRLEDSHTSKLVLLNSSNHQAEVQTENALALLGAAEEAAAKAYEEALAEEAVAALALNRTRANAAELIRVKGQLITAKGRLAERKAS